jgi:hypothetical protein
MKSLILTVEKLGFFKALVGGAILALPIFLFIAKKIYDLIYLKKSALLATDLAYEEYEWVENNKDKYLRRRLAKRKIKIKRTKTTVEILKFNPNLNSQNIQSLVPTIERIFKRKVIEVEFKNYGLFKHKEKIVFVFEHFKKLITKEDLKEKLEIGSYWLGQGSNGQNLINDRKRPFIFVVGGQGSGKSVAVGSYIISLVSSFTNNGKPQPKIIMVSGQKQSEFVPLIQRFSKTGEVLTFNANSLEEIKALNQILKDHLDKCGKFFEVIKNENLIVRHWFDIEHPEKPEPVIFLFDEAPEYLGEQIKVKISKDSSPEEIELHSINLEKNKLGFYIDRCFKILRETATYIFIASQTGNSSDLEAISFTNLRTNVLLGRGIIKAVFSLYGIPPEYQDQKLGEGMFVFASGGNVGVLKTPFLTADDNGGKK